jgi:Tfp pilus assembly protein PilW
MACKTTFTDVRQRGLTLVQVMVGTAIGSVVLAAVASLSIFAGRSFAALGNYSDLDAQSRKALDRMTREIRQASRLKSSSTNQLIFVDADGADLSYVYDPGARTLTRVKGGQAEVFLKECDQLEFSIYQRNPINGSYDVYPTASAATCKLVQLTWVCSRTILGARMNTESVQSAKVVIRKQ